MDDKLKEFAEAQSQSKASLEQHLYKLITKFEQGFGVNVTDIALKRLEAVGQDSRLMSVKVTAEIK